MQPFIESWGIDQWVRHNIYAMPILAGMFAVAMYIAWMIARNVVRILTRK
jgi:hypothetical protein